MVGQTLRFLIEEVGEVEGTYPTEGALSEKFALRRAAGNGIELLGILAFRASPVWVMAALADASGAGRNLVREIADSLKQEGLLDPDTEREFITALPPEVRAIPRNRGGSVSASSRWNCPPPPQWEPREVPRYPVCRALPGLHLRRRAGFRGRIASVCWRVHRPADGTHRRPLR